jgi:hypothetical protein
MVDVIVLAVTNLVTLAMLVGLSRVSRQEIRYERERAADREDLLYEQKREREDQLLNRIQAPQPAVSQSLTQLGDVDTSVPVYISSSADDEQWEDYEDQKRQLEVSTRDLITTVLGDTAPNPADVHVDEASNAPITGGPGARY